MLSSSARVGEPAVVLPVPLIPASQVDQVSVHSLCRIQADSLKSDSLLKQFRDIWSFAPVCSFLFRAFCHQTRCPRDAPPLSFLIAAQGVPIPAIRKESRINRNPRRIDASTRRSRDGGAAKGSPSHSRATMTGVLVMCSTTPRRFGHGGHSQKVLLTLVMAYKSYRWG